MNLRLSSLRAMFMHQGTGRLTAAAALAFTLVGAGMGSAVAAPGDAASAPAGASVSYAAGSQYTVQPGQSLNDVAIAVTQSHDKGTLARASRALFDANPNAFMKNDPSRMRVGALLTVPALDASGALTASSAAAGAAPVAASAAAPASAPSTAPSGVASGVAQINAAAASAASAAARAAAPATPAVSGAASSAAEASLATPGSTTAAVAASGTPAAGVLPASGAHVWSGAVQPSASEPAEGASAAATATAPATATVQPASQPRAQVSSLQQLLALKNRVLMELQKHGIGGSPAARVTPSTNGAQPAVGVSSAAAISGHGDAAISTSNDVGISQTNLSVAAAIGAALVVLLAAWRLRRRKRTDVAAAEGSPVEDAAAAPQDAPFPREEIPARETSGVSDEVAARHTAALAEREAAERDADIRAAAEREAVERAAAEQAATERVAAESAAAQQAAAEHKEADHAAVDEATQEPAAAERAAEQASEHVADQAADQAAEQREVTGHQPHTALPVQDPSGSQHASQQDHAPASFEPAQPNPDTLAATQSGLTSEPLPVAHHENLDGATTAASLAAAAELGADALPLTSLEPVDETFQQEVPPHRLQWDDEPTSSESSAPTAQSTHDPLAEPQPQSHQHQQADTATPETATHFEPSPVAPIQPALAAPTEFPRDAVDAFSSLDMPLPPRVESTDTAAVNAPVSLSTQPVASPETTAQQAVAPYDPDDAPHVADEIAAGTAGHAAVAGLGAAGLGAVGFGALKLDFDLELPPSPAQPLPAFTQADLSRIARNKLDLAAEYIDLGDLSGARALINEVIEANDPATRTEARALLSTLAPLS